VKVFSEVQKRETEWRWGYSNKDE